ncbi:hypothetical protein YC2023_043464 [Brassica napus]
MVTMSRVHSCPYSWCSIDMSILKLVLIIHTFSNIVDIVVDIVTPIEPKHGDLLSNIFFSMDMLMLTHCSGCKERSFSQFEALAIASAAPFLHKVDPPLLSTSCICLRTRQGIKSKRSLVIIIISKEMSVSLVLSKMSTSSVSCGTSFTGENNELGISDWLITIS